MGNYFSQKCPHCGNMMYMSSSDKTAVCLNCNKTFEVDTEKIRKFDSEKEEKQKKAAIRKKENKRIDKLALCFLIFGLSIIIFFIIFSQNKKHENINVQSKMIKVSYSSHYFRNEKLLLENVIKKLKSNGFINITYEPIYDIVFGFLVKEKEVEKVVIDGNEIFIKGDKFPQDCNVVIYYHENIDNEALEKNNITEQSVIKESKESEENALVIDSSTVPKEIQETIETPKYYGTYIGNKKSVIMIGKEKAVYYYKDSIYDKKVKYSEENEKIILDVEKLGYKIYFDKSYSYDYDFNVESTNENWENESFIKYSDKYNFSRDDMRKIITSSLALKRMPISIIKDELNKDGYNNVTLEPKYDVVLGILAASGDTEGVSINGETDFDSYLDYSKDVNIKIYYHEDVSKEPKEVQKFEEKNENKIKGSVIDDDGIKQNESEGSLSDSNGNLKLVSYKRKLNKDYDSYLVFEFDNSVCYEADNVDNGVYNARFYGDLYNGIDVIYDDTEENWHDVYITHNNDISKLYKYDSLGCVYAYTLCDLETANKYINKEGRTDLFVIKEYSESDRMNSSNIIKETINNAKVFSN